MECRLSERTNFWEKPTRGISTYSSGGSVATRTNSFSYAGDGIDLITATGFAGELVLSNAYTGYHEVATSYSAVNDRTDYSYRSFDHLLDWVHWPTGCTTTNSYLGSLPPWLTYSRDYDGATSAQLRSWGLDFYSWNLDLPKDVTDPRGLTVTNSFDNLRRPTTVAYPGSSFVHAYLDSGSQARFELQTVTDPQSRVTRLTYDGLARVCENKDRCSHTTQAGYACGSCA